MRASSLFLAVLLPSAALGAQSTLIGLGYDPAALVPAAIIQQTLCQPGNRACPVPGFAPVLMAPWAGGAAYNGRNQSVWATDGLLMVETRVQGCQTICRIPAANGLGAGSFTGGLEISPGLGRMHQVESLPGVAALHVWNIAVCPPVVGPACQFPLPSVSHTCGGVAIDEASGQIFYAASIFGAGGPANFILGALLSSPCNILCRMPVRGCGTAVMGPIRGLCFEECSQTLHLTDGTQTLTMRRSAASPCGFTEVACCNPSPQTGSYAWVGLEVEPQHAATIGRSCFGQNCTPCPNMTLGAQGDAVLGNPTFQLSLTGAQVGSVMAIAVSPGACNVPGLPVLCGQWHPSLGTTIFFPTVPVGGGGVCQGSAQMPVPIPTNFALCGAPLCFQSVVVCVSAVGAGINLTNAVEAVLN